MKYVVYYIAQQDSMIIVTVAQISIVSLLQNYFVCQIPFSNFVDVVLSR